MSFPFLMEHCAFCRMTPEIVAKCGDFSCLSTNKDSKDINDFFHGEYELYAKNRYCKSFCFVHKDDRKLVAAFTLSATSISVKNNKKLNKSAIESTISAGEELPQYPAVLLGQLAVFNGYNGKRIGYEVINFVKAILSEPNPVHDKHIKFNNIGARFIITDAKNFVYNIRMYLDCGFDYAFSTHIPHSKSIKMFFDLSTI